MAVDRFAVKVFDIAGFFSLWVSGRAAIDGRNWRPEGKNGP